MHEDKMDEYGRALCVRGYHVYREIWEAAVAQVLICEREPRNGKDRYAVAVQKDYQASLKNNELLAATP